MENKQALILCTQSVEEYESSIDLRLVECSYQRRAVAESERSMRMGPEYGNSDGNACHSVLALWMVGAAALVQKN